MFTENLSLHSVDKQKSCDKNQKICSKKKNKTDEENFGGSLALVPLVDMLNHSPDASVYFQLIRVCGYNLRTLLLEYHPVSLVHCLLFRFDI